MADSDKKTIISLFAHPDDELGAIGTLANHAERGDRVFVTWTTYGELTTLLPDLTAEEIKKERKRHGDEIAKIVGAEKAIFLDLGDSYVSTSREHRVAVAKMYAELKPNAVITWGLNNNHSDHRKTGWLALEATQAARISRVVNMKPHRDNVRILQYFEKESKNPIKYIDVSDVMDTIKAAANFYAEIYDWKDVESWTVDGRRSRGIESHCKYAEKFNMRFDFSKPEKYAV